MEDKLNSMLRTENEVEINKYWEENGVYQKVLDQNVEGETYRFMDGPPFVSSENLHFGHLHVGYIKSSILNYKQMNGFNVLNKIGYDCHGLPIEMVVNGILGVSTKAEVEALGIDKYNDKCREVIKNYSGSWRKIYNRIGRMIRHDDEYKTMDTKYMETVWWVFKTLWEKNLVYKGYKIMPYSTFCKTPLSNFEANGEDNYKEIVDPAIYIKFKLKNEKDTYFVVWTTTPWTLPTNVGLCVNSEIIYVKIKDHKTNDHYIMAESCLSNVYPKSKTPPYTIIEKNKGSNYENCEYIPIFTYYDDGRTFRVVTDNFVEDKNGSGIVHLSCGHGEDDFNVCLNKGIVTLDQVESLCPIDDSGNFTDKISDYKGVYVRDANEQIINKLKLVGLLVKKEGFKHKYPFCPRSDTPLIYRAVSSVFIKVTELKDKLIQNNNKVKWVPEYIGNSRFHNWLSNVKDWGISRSRFFGTPIPLWVSDDGQEMVCIGSIDELVKEANLDERPEDLHKEFIDTITIKSKTGHGVLKNIGLLFDCWFESGAVPFGQIHYPFENETVFDNVEYLSDFICEGLDQTRGWFYTLMVLSTAIFDKPAFKNVICSGLILDKDGKKFSKRYGNYVSPYKVLDEHGSDALRMYLISSPAAHAEPFKFNEDDIKIIRNKYNQLTNCVKFLLECTIKLNKDGNSFEREDYQRSNNVMDGWILSRLRSTINNINGHMSSYLVYNVCHEIMTFIEDLTNWYVKFNRNRLRRRFCDLDEQKQALSTLFYTLLSFSKVIAPFVPYLAETIYRNLTSVLEDTKEVGKISVHMCSYPNLNDFPQDDVIERKMSRLQSVCSMVRSIRSRDANIRSAKVPLKCVIVSNNDGQFVDDVKGLQRYLNEEINAVNVEYRNDNELLKYNLVVNNKTVGRKYRSLLNKIKNVVSDLSSDKIDMFITSGILTFTIDGVDVSLDKDDVEMTKLLNDKCEYIKQFGNWSSVDNNTVVIVDPTRDDQVTSLYIMRLFITSVQRLRKDTKLKPWNKIKIYYETDSDKFKSVIGKFYDTICQELIYKVYDMSDINNDDPLIVTKSVKILDIDVKITLTE